MTAEEARAVLRDVLVRMRAGETSLTIATRYPGTQIAEAWSRCEASVFMMELVFQLGRVRGVEWYRVWRYFHEFEYDVRFYGGSVVANNEADAVRNMVPALSAEDVASEWRGAWIDSAEANGKIEEWGT